MEAATRAVFTRFDTDSSGFLDHAELGNLLNEFGFTDADVDTELRLGSKSGDGKIDFPEFVTYFNNLKLRQQAAAGAPVVPRFETATRVARPGTSGGPPKSAREAPAATSLEGVFLVCIRFAKFASECVYL